MLCDSWYKERNLQLDLPWQNADRSSGTYLERGFLMYDPLHLSHYLQVRQIISTTTQTQLFSHKHYVKSEKKEQKALTGGKCFSKTSHAKRKLIFVLFSSLQSEGWERLHRSCPASCSSPSCRVCAPNKRKGAHASTGLSLHCCPA